MFLSSKTKPLRRRLLNYASGPGVCTARRDTSESEFSLTPVSRKRLQSCTDLKGILFAKDARIALFPCEVSSFYATLLPLFY